MEVILWTVHLSWTLAAVCLLAWFELVASHFIINYKKDSSPLLLPVDVLYRFRRPYHLPLFVNSRGAVALHL